MEQQTRTNAGPATSTATSTAGSPATSTATSTAGSTATTTATGPDGRSGPVQSAAYGPSAPAAERADFVTPTESRTFPLGQLDLVSIGGGEVGRLTLQPGWRWSQHVKPIAGTELCEAPHFQYHVSGILRIRTADGVEFDAVPGQITALPSGHDAWVIGDQPVVVVDWCGASNYAK